MAEIKYKDVLADFITDIDNNPNLTDEEIFKAYPEFNNDKKLLDAAYQYRNTWKANDYDEPTLQSKFPEFFTPAQPTQPANPSVKANGYNPRPVTSMGGYNPVPFDAQPLVDEEEGKKQVLQRQAAAKLPTTQEDQARAAEIRRLGREGMFGGTPSSFEMGVDENGHYYSKITEGEQHLLPFNANQEQINQLLAQQPEYMKRPNDTEEHIMQNIEEAVTANTEAGRAAKANLEQGQKALITELQGVFDATDRGKEINQRYSGEYQQAFKSAYGTKFDQATKQILARYQQSFEQSDAVKQIAAQYQKGLLTEAQANANMDAAFKQMYGQQYQQEANALWKKYQDEFSASKEAQDINTRHNEEYNTAFAEDMDEAYQQQMGGLLQNYDKALKDIAGDFYEGRMREMKHNVANKMIGNTEKIIGEAERAAMPKTGWERMAQSNLTDPIYGFGNTPAGKDDYLMAAHSFLDKAKQRMNDVSIDRYQAGDFTKNVGYDLKGIIESTMSFGLSDLRDAHAITSVFEKVNSAAEAAKAAGKDPQDIFDNPSSVLNDKERAVYDAYCTMMAADIARQTDTSYLANAARLTAEMIPFMLEVGAMNGIFGGLNRTASRAITRGMVRSIVSKLPRGFGRTAARGLTGLATNLAGASLYAGESAAMAFVLPRTYANMLQNKIKVADDPGAITFTKDRLVINDFDVNTTSDAFWKAWRDEWKELFTETGGVFQVAGGLMFKNPIVKQISRKVGQTPMGKLIDVFSTGRFFEYAKQMGYHGTYKEWLEEVEGTCWDYVFGDEDAFEKFFSRDTQIPMLMSFSVPSVIGGGVNAARELNYRREYKKASDSVLGLLNKYGYSAEDLDGIKQSLYATNVEDIPTEVMRMASMLTNADNFGDMFGEYTRLQLKARNSKLTQEEQGKMDALYNELFKKENVATADTKALASELTKLAYAEVALSSVDRDMAHDRSHAIEEARQYYRDAMAERANQQQTEQEQQQARITQEVQVEVQPITHQDGNLYHVGVKGKDGVDGYVVSGNLNLSQDEQNGSFRTSGRDLVTIKMSDGTVEQVPADEVTILDAPMSANDRVAQEVERRTIIEQGKQQFHAGDKVQYTYVDPLDNQLKTVETDVLDVTDEGVVVAFQGPNGVADTTPISFETAMQNLQVIDSHEVQGANLDEEGIVTFRMPDNRELHLRDMGNGTYQTIPEEEDEETYRFTTAELQQLGAQRVEQAPVQPVQGQAPAAPVQPVQPAQPQFGSNAPGIDELSAEDFAAQTVSFMQSPKVAQGYLTAERAKVNAQLQQLEKEGVTEYNSAEEYRTKAQQLEQSKARLQAQLEKIDGAIAAINAQAEAAVARQNLNEAIRKRAAEFSKQLGANIVIFDSLEQIPESQAEARAMYQQAGDAVDGWYDPKTGDIYMNANAYDDIQRFEEKVFHEVVSHKGLDQLLGTTNYNALCDSVWNSMDAATRKKYMDYAKANNIAKNAKGYQRIATKEYIAFLSESFAKLELNDQSAEANNIRSEWAKICDFLRELFKKIFGNVQITNEDLAQLIHASFVNMQRQAQGITEELAADEQSGAAGNAQVQSPAPNNDQVEEQEQPIATPAEVQVETATEDELYSYVSRINSLGNYSFTLSDGDADVVKFAKWLVKKKPDDALKWLQRGNIVTNSFARKIYNACVEKVNKLQQPAAEVTETHAEVQSETQAPKEQTAADFLNEALAEVSQGNVPANITIDETTIRDEEDSAEMDARLLIDGKPSNLSVTIFDQSLGSRGGYDPANLVKYYPFDNADNWSWEKADVLVNFFNKGEHSGKASVLDESDAVYFTSLQAAMEFAEFVNSEAANSPEVRLALAEAETDPNPTEAQKKAENYKQGHVTLWGLPITIENPKGSIRRGTDANGKQWEQEMHHTYGKIRRTEGVDGDHIDVFIGPNLTSDKVFVVDQRNVDTGEFDEHKCMLGFDSLEDAQNGYLSNYEEGWQGMGTVTEVTMDEFKKWIDSSHRKTKPFAEYKSVKTEGAAATAMEQAPTENQETSETQAEDLTPLEAAQKRKAAREAAKAAEQAAQPQGESEMLTRLRELQEGEDQQAPQDYLHSLTDEQLDVLEDEVNELWNKARTENNLRDLNDQQIREQYPEAWKTLLLRNRVSAENSRRWDMQTTEESIANRKAHTESEELRRYYEYEFAYMRASASKGDVLKAVHDAEEYLAGLSYEELAKIYNEIVRLQSEHDVPWILSNAYRARSANMENEGVFDYGLNHQGEIPEGKANKPKINANDWTANDELRPVMNGVYHDPTGVGVVTNAHILMATPSLYDPAQEGKIVKKDGSTVDGQFPNWQGVVDQARRINKKEATVDWTAIRNFIAGVKAKMKAEGTPLKKDSLANIIIRMPDGQVVIYRMNMFIPFADAAASVGANTLHYSPINGQTYAENNGSQLIIMPVDPESFRKNLDWGYKDNFYYDLQPKQDEPVSAETPKTESKPERKPKPTRKKAAPAEQTQAPVETDAEVIETQKPKNADKIEDVGEKIGGARKDIVQDTVDRINVNGDTFAKIFPKFDYHKLIANGLEPRLAAGLKYVCEHAKKSYKIRKKRFGEKNALEATRFMANYAKGYLLGDTSLDFTSEGWVFTAYGKRRYEFGIKLWESLREAMGDTMFDVDLSGYDCDVIQSEEERKAEAEEKGRTYRPSSSIYYRRNADGESVEFTPRYAINTPKGDKLFTAEEYDQAVQYFQDQVTSAINYQAANPFELAIYRKRGSDDCCVHAKIGGKWVELTPWGKEYGLKYRDEHRAELQAMAQRKAEELKEQRKNTRPEAKVELRLTRREDGTYGNQFQVKLGKEYVPIKDDIMPITDSYKYLREHREELTVKAQEMLNAYLDEQEANRGWKPQLNIGGLRNRVGTDWRNGADVTAERFRTEFGFRGVEFGNYVTQKERQRLLNECFDALHDMAEILGVSPRALSLNGQLGFAIGARGGAGAKAHYEPGKNVINLTKKNGWGALAHEWWHAMDYYFGKREKERPATSGIFRDDVRKQMQDAFAAVMKAINGSEYLKRSQNLDAKTNKRYYAEDTELGARAFEDYIAKQLIERGQVNDFLSHHTAEEDWNGDISNYPYPIEKDGVALADAFQAFFDTVEEQEDESTGNSVLFSVTDKKYAQFALTHTNNPMLDDVHTGIRSVEDIHTLEETLNDDKLLVTEPDWEEEDIRRAIEDNQVTIYSSKPIQDGTFVTPSRMVAEDYAGGEIVYEKTVSPDKVAWIASDEGQYADVDHYDGNILFSITNANNEIFYSNAERAVEGIKQDKATPEQWRAMIEKAGGLKAGEDKWIGLSDWLAQQRPTIESHPDETPLQFAQRTQAERKKFTISKQEILHYIRANKIQIEETEYGETTPENNPTFRAFQDEVTEMWENVNRTQNGRFNEAVKDIIRYEDELEAKYGEDFRDMMDDSERNTMNYLQERRDEINMEVFLPEEVVMEEMCNRHGDDFQLAFSIDDDGSLSIANEDAAGYYLDVNPINDTRLQYTTEGLTNKHEIAMTVPTIEAWNETDEIHFGDAGEGRVVAWVRFGDTTDEQGNKTLVIDEIQSKRHQEGREHGYIEKSADKAMTDYTNMLYRKYGVQFNVKMSDEERMEYRRLQREREFERQDNLSRPTPAPFEKNWHELAMKRILRFAAENGYDKVAWTTGDQQAARYNIGNHVDGIDANPFMAGVTPDIDYDGTQILIYTDGATLEMDVDKDGNVVKGYESASMEYEGKNISDIVGKEIARKLLTGEEVKLRGEDFRIGGEGMRGFYDDILPRFMQKYGKKWGVQVGEVTMPQLEDGYQTMHAIDINDAMRESVLDGQPMFSISGRGVNGTMKPQEGETRSQYIARVAETVKNMTPRNTTIDDAIRFSITVNHNSPYLLKRADGAFIDPETGERLGFDHRFMGKGEGGQAHGWGTYLSVNDLRDYAEARYSNRGKVNTYKGMQYDDVPKTLENFVPRMVLSELGGKEIALDMRGEPKEAKFRQAVAFVRAAIEHRTDEVYHGLLDDYYRAELADEPIDNVYSKVIRRNPQELADELLKQLDAISMSDFQIADRHHYSVEIPDNDGTNYLEETVPMNERARKAIADGLVADGYQMEEKSNDEFSWLEFRKGDSSADPDNQIGLNEDATYRDFIHDNFHGYDSKMLPKISEYLSKAGIVGIHYDGRRDGECYVIFDENDAVITNHVLFSITPKNTSLDQVLFSITVNHNSPYLLKKADGSFVDPATGERLGFDHRFIGSGEGAQAHGWGSYFSQNDIEGYRQETKTYKDEPVAADPYSDNAADRALFYYEQEGGTQKAVKFLRELMREEDDADTKREYQECIDVLLDEKSWGERKGHRYIVEIPDNDGTNYLDEMKTLPKPLRRKIAAAVRELPGKPERSVKYVDYVGGWNQLADMIERNQWAYLEIRDRLFNAFGGYPIDSEKRLSKLMSSLGFVGVHYDGRRDGECYVIFNENDAKIVDHVMFSITEKDPLKRWEAENPKPKAKEGEPTIDYAKRLQQWNNEHRKVKDAIKDAQPSYDHAEYDGVLFSTTPPFTGETIGDVAAGARQRSDLNRKRRESAAITDMLIQLSKDNYWRMQEALHKINADIRALRKATAMQADLDRSQVEALLDLTNQLIQVQWGGGSDNPAYQPQTMATIIQQVRNAIGKADISEEVGKIEDYLVHAQRVAAKNQWDKLRRTPFEKLNISGVVSQGKVAIQGQHALKALNEALNSRMTVEQLEEEISLLYQKIDEATDESLRTQYTGRMIGYETARQHLERLEELMQERQQLRNELEASRTKKELSPAARRELEASIKETLRDNNLRQAEAYTQSVRDLQEYVSGQTDIAKNFIEQQRQRTEMIRGYAAKDLEGASADPHRTNEKQSGWRKIWDAFASPIRDLQSLLRLTGLHAPDGEGYLYNHFMRNWTDAADKERQGIVAAQQTLDAKISELTHGKYKTWEDAARDIKSKSHNKLSVSLWTGKFDGAQPVYEDRPIDAGNALYIYAVNKMNDGRMKLTAMNITDQKVRDLANQVKEMFGQEILDVVDWVQREFFSELRNRYNPTHEALFGAPMDAIENYFPLRINASARQKDEDITEPDDDTSRLLSGTSTGAIKRRKRNSLPLDVRNADFFQEVIRHVAQMERWNAFAQWTRDSNILFSDIDFRNKIKNMDTIYGKGDKLYTYMKKAFQTAVGVYKPQSDIFSEMTLNLAKGVTSAKINFRVFTALKQLASFPAFFTYMTESGFVKSYMSSWVHPHDTMKWAKANLPSFEKRVSKRDMGDMRLMQRSTDWEWNKRMLELSQKYGMYFNVLFDTLTCATGAKAVYESRLAEYKKKGYSTAVAESRARQDAEQAFNTSQQSSEGAYMAPVQMDRNIITAALTVFRTSPIQYTRNCFYHARNLIRKRGKGTKESMINFRIGQYIADGLTEEQARQAAEKDYNKSVARDIVGMVVYGALLGILWRIVGSLPYLVAGDDDDEKKKILKKAVTGGAIVQPVTGLLGGGIVESAIDGYGNIADMFSPELPFTQDLKKAFDNIGSDKYAEAASQALSVMMQSATGFDPNTVADMITRTVTTLDSDAKLDAAQQAWQISGAVLSIPQSQYEQIMLDDLVKAGKGIDMSNTYGKYKFEPIYDKYLSDFTTNREIRTAPLTWYLRSDEQAQKAEASAERRFRKLLKERGLNDLPDTKQKRDKKK